MTNRKHARLFYLIGYLLVMVTACYGQKPSGIVVILGPREDDDPAANKLHSVQIDIFNDNQQLLPRKEVKTADDWKAANNGLSFDFGYGLESADKLRVVIQGDDTNHAAWNGAAGFIINVSGGRGSILADAKKRAGSDIKLQPSGSVSDLVRIKPPSDLTRVYLKATSPTVGLRSTKATFQLRRFLSADVSTGSQQVIHSYTVDEPWQWDVLSQEGLILFIAESLDDPLRPGIVQISSDFFGIVAFAGTPEAPEDSRLLKSLDLMVSARPNSQDDLIVVNGYGADGAYDLDPIVEDDTSFYKTLFGHGGVVWRIRKLH